MSTDAATVALNAPVLLDVTVFTVRYDVAPAALNCSFTDRPPSPSYRCLVQFALVIFPVTVTVFPATTGSGVASTVIFT